MKSIDNTKLNCAKLKTASSHFLDLCHIHKSYSPFSPILSSHPPPSYQPAPSPHSQPNTKPFQTHSRLVQKPRYASSLPPLPSLPPPHSQITLINIQLKLKPKPKPTPTPNPKKCLNQATSAVSCARSQATSAPSRRANRVTSAPSRRASQGTSAPSSASRMSSSLTSASSRRRRRMKGPEDILHDMPSRR